MKCVSYYYFDLSHKSLFLQILRKNGFSVSKFCYKLKIRKNLFFSVLDGDVPIEFDDLFKWFRTIYPLYLQALSVITSFCLVH